MTRNSIVIARNARLGALVLLTLSLAACTKSCGRTSAKAVPVPAVPFDAEVLKPSPKLDVHFYIDSSSPMNGFLATPKEGQTNHFMNLLDRRSGLVSGAWTDAKVQFWRFGKGEPRSIPDLRAFLQPKAFDDTQSHIEEAVRHEVPVEKGRAQLKVIVTDLFQNDTDIDLLAKEWSERYLNNPARAVGIMGVRNIFYGMVDDLPGKVKPGGADSLPFYILVTGQIGDVRTYFSALRSGLGLDRAAPGSVIEMIFAQNLNTAPTPPLRYKAAVPNKPGYAETGAMVAGASNAKIPQLIVSADPVLNLLDFPHAEIAKLPSNVQLKPAVEKKVVVYRAGPGEGKEDPALNEAFDVDIKAGTLTIHKAKLPADAICLLQFTLLGETGPFQDVKNWNLEIGDARRVVANNQFDKAPDDTLPGKTPNLLHFLRTLSNKTFLTRVPLAQYHLFVKKQ